MPFSAGARACLGRKFAETEGVAMMVSLISRYKFEVMEEPQFAGETFAQRKERVLKTAVGLTLTCVRPGLDGEASVLITYTMQACTRTLNVPSQGLANLDVRHVSSKQETVVYVVRDRWPRTSFGRFFTSR